MEVVRRLRKEKLMSTLTLKTLRWLDIDAVNSSRDCIGPKMRRNRGRQKKGAGDFNDVPVLVFGNAILGVSTGTRELGKSALIREKLTERSRHVFST